MQRRRNQSQLPLSPQMEIAPFIDIVFQQLIFFMLTSAFIFQPGVKIQLPKSVTADVAHRPIQVITVSKEDHLFWGNRLVTLAELRRELSSFRKTKDTLLIRADRGASLGRVVEIWDLCRSLGISQVNIATSQAEGG